MKSESIHQYRHIGLVFLMILAALSREWIGRSYCSQSDAMMSRGSRNETLSMQRTLNSLVFQLEMFSDLTVE